MNPPPLRRQDPIAPLLVGTAAGDHGAFAALYDEVASRVYGLVLRVIGEVHEAEDVAREVLVQVWNTAESFDPGREGGLAWILTQAHRRAVERARKSRLSGRRSTDPLIAAEAEPGGDQAREDVTRLQDALSRLTTTQDRAVRLAYFDGHTHREVSDLLGVSAATAKIRIRDGLIRLRDDLSIPA